MLETVGSTEIQSVAFLKEEVGIVCSCKILGQ